MRWKMRKIVISFALFALISGIDTIVEASVWQTIKNVGSKTANAVKTTVSDRLHKRGGSNDTSNLNNIISYIKQFKSNISSSASYQLKYIKKQFPTSSEDLSVLISYYSFAKNCELLFSVLEPILSKIRTDQATLLGNTDSSNSELTLQNSLQVLMSNGVKSAETILQTSAITLLQVVQRASENGEIPQTNISTLYNQINSLMSNQLFSLIVGLTTNIANIQGSDENIGRINSLIKNILLIQKVLMILQSYINGGNVVGQIENILQSCEYYSGQLNGYGNFSVNSGSYGALVPYQNPYGTVESEDEEDEEDEE